MGPKWSNASPSSHKYVNSVGLITSQKHCLANGACGLIALEIKKYLCIYTYVHTYIWGWMWYLPRTGLTQVFSNMFYTFFQFRTQITNPERRKTDPRRGPHLIPIYTHIYIGKSFYIFDLPLSKDHEALTYHYYNKCFLRQQNVVAKH